MNNDQTSNQGQAGNEAEDDQDQDTNTGSGADTSSIPHMDELQMLKTRARMMGITHSNNISVETLRQKIAEKQAENAEARDQNLVAAARGVNPLEQAQQGQKTFTGSAVNVSAQAVNKPVRKLPLRKKLHNSQMKLVRVRITCLDPKKKDLPGEILTVANGVLGTVRKFVPYGEHTDNGFHIPYILLRMMQRRKFLNIRTTRDKRTNTDRVSATWAREFAIEILDPLTKAEIENLKVAQLASNSVENQGGQELL